VTFATIVIKRSDDGKCGQKSQLSLRVFGPGVITDMATDQLLVPQRFGADQLGQRRSWLGHFSGGIPQRRPVGDLVPQVGQPQQRNHCRRGVRPSRLGQKALSPVADFLIERATDGAFCLDNRRAQQDRDQTGQRCAWGAWKKRNRRSHRHQLLLWRRTGRQIEGNGWWGRLEPVGRARAAQQHHRHREQRSDESGQDHRRCQRAPAYQHRSRRPLWTHRRPRRAKARPSHAKQEAHWPCRCPPTVRAGFALIVFGCLRRSRVGLQRLF
jgi:hypothetical protein